MVIFKKAEDLRHYLAQQARPIGFVPTMGALHAGHTSLLKRANEDGLLSVVSIFVNPTQFNDKEDFKKYPITIDADTALLLEAGCNVLFLPSVEEVYPGGPEHTKVYEFGYLETVLEGARRPGHFRGVGQVVGRLLEIVQPQVLYLGQKDYQQCMIIRDLVQQMGKADSIRLVFGTTVREPDGLAMSSRNRRLTEPQRALAGVIYQCLVSIQSKQGNAPFATVEKECVDLLRDKGFEPEYVALAQAEDLELLEEFDAGKKMVALIAARLGNVRLIDNILLN